METRRSRTRSGAVRESCPDSIASHAARIEQLERATCDREAIERSILEAATSLEPRGARAWLMVWNPRQDRLDGWALAGAPGSSAEFAGGPAETRAEVERLGAWRSHSTAPEKLVGAPGEAWRSGSPALSPGGDAWPWRGAASLGATPIRRGNALYGLLVVEWEAAGNDEARLEALGSLQRLAAAALALHERAGETKRRSQRSSALSELGRAVVSSLNLTEALHLAARLAAQSTSSRGCALWVAAQGGELRLEVTHGPGGVRERLGRALGPLAQSVRDEGRPRLPARVTDDALLSPDAAAQMASLAAFPIAAYGRVLGVLAVYDRAAPHPADLPEYDAVDLEFLSGLCDLTALVLDQAARFDALRQSELRCDELRARVRREERLASVGEMAARAAEEARNPLASIGAFACRVHRELQAEDPHREYLEIVMREAERLERIVGEPARHAPPEPPRLRLGSVNAVLQEVLRGAGESLVRRRVRLLKKLSPDLPPLLLDVDRVRQVLANLLSHAVSGVPAGGRIRVESRRAHPYVVVDVAHDGPRRPGDSLEDLFVPFASDGGEGPGLGLAAAQRIVHEHGGEIRVRSEPEWPSVVSFTVPIHENQDRRTARAERRGERSDRRRRYPES